MEKGGRTASVTLLFSRLSAEQFPGVGESRIRDSRTSEKTGNFLNTSFVVKFSYGSKGLVIDILLEYFLLIVR